MLNMTSDSECKPITIVTIFLLKFVSLSILSTQRNHN